ncbi:MAG: glycosyltransferase family protein [Calditrichaceae bacterium]|jgi:uncharacterized protein (TIGR00661 family)
MKILYAIQGTGNGHLSRAKDVIPALKKRAQVDLVVSGIHAEVNLPYKIKYRYKGFGFIFGKKGSIDLSATYKANKIRRFYKEIISCPVENYDLVINDFEPVSAWAARLKGIPCFSLSHQSALHSDKVPKPRHNDWLGLFILKFYAPANKSYSFHFKKYDDQIYTPVIRREIRSQRIYEGKHITVYLPAYEDKRIIDVLKQINHVQFEVFSKHSKKSYEAGNVKIKQINAQEFSRSMAGSKGVFCGAGFETPAEALFMGKKLLVIPMRRQYEQHFNAESLHETGVPVIPRLSSKYIENIRQWIEYPQNIKVDFPDETQRIIDELIYDYNNIIAIESHKSMFNLFPKLEFIYA